MTQVRLEVTGRIAQVVMDRPKVNALDATLLEEIAEVMRQLADDPTVDGVLLCGAGRAYSAGLDLKVVRTLDDQAIADFVSKLDDALLACFAFPKPLACPVAGHAIAGGLVIAFTGDFLPIADDPSIKLGLTELAVGVPFPRSAFEIVRTALPPRGLRRLIYEAGTFAPAEAFALGCGDVVCDDPLGAAKAWLAQAVSRPLDTFRYVKAMLREDPLRRIHDASEPEREAFLHALNASRKSLVQG